MGESAASILVAVVQFAPGDDRMRNRGRIAAFVAVAAARGARLVVFPEYSSYFVHPLGDGFVHNAEPLDGDFVAALGEAAREHGVFVVAGLVERTQDARRFSNTLVAVDPSGLVVATYRKQHLYDAFGSASPTGSCRASRRRAGDLRASTASASGSRPATTSGSPRSAAGSSMPAPSSSSCPPSGCADRSRSTTGARSLHARAPSRTRSTSRPPTMRRRSASAPR